METAPAPSSVFPYLRSCKQETAEATDGQLTGEIPRWLKGCLIRIGSGLLEIGPDRYNHVFDGMALMHQFRFRDGRVTYQNRFLRSDAYKNNTRANRIVVSEFATRGAPDPCKTIFQRFASLFSFDEMTDNDLVNVVMYGNEAFACSETNNIWKIDVETLESLQKVNLRKYLPVDGAIAHAHEDTDGTVYNIGTSYGLYSYYNVIKFPPKEDKSASPFDNGSVVCKIPASKTLNPCYYHSFAMTENYFVMVEQPLYLSLSKMTWAHFVAGAYSSALYWDPKAMSRFHVVRRSDGKLLDTSYVAEPFFVFHHINAYEEDGHLVMDLCGYEKGDVVNMLYVKALEELSNPKLFQDPFVSRARRYVLPLNLDKERKVSGVNLVTLPNCKAAATLITDGSVLCSFEILTGNERWSPELPRINYEKFNGRKYRYFYAMARNENLERTHLVKVDTETKKTISWNEEGVIPSEPVFLEEPDPSSREEDSGVVLASLLYRNDETKVSMLVLDARTMVELGRVTFKTGSAVPADFHGTFVPRS